MELFFYCTSRTAAKTDSALGNKLNLCFCYFYRKTFCLLIVFSVVSLFPNYEVMTNKKKTRFTTLYSLESGRSFLWLQCFNFSGSSTAYVRKYFSVSIISQLLSSFSKIPPYIILRLPQKSYDPIHE